MTASILRNADLRTQDERAPRAEAIAWRDGGILAVGSNEQVSAAAGEGARAFDAAGATVLPGFVDAHHHPAIVALYGGSLRLAAPEVHDIASLQRALAARSRALAPGEWLVATEWDELTLAERRPPTRAELDDAVPDRPLFALHYSCHRAAVNGQALALAGVSKGTPDPPGGVIERGPGGVPSGVVLERALSPFERLARASLVARDAGGFLARLAAHHRALVAEGITLVVDATVPMDLEALYREAARRGLLLARTVMMPVSARGYLEAPLDVLDGDPAGEGDAPLLRRGPVKLVFDGAPQCSMCLGWLQSAGAVLGALALAARRGSLDPVRASLSVTPRLGAKIRSGIAIYDAAEARAVVARAAERGFAVATHAIGNAAIDVALDAYAACGPALARAGTPRLEHATFLDRDTIRRVADLGVAVVIQPIMLGLPTFASAPSIPGLRAIPARWLLDAGVLVAGSSDHPVARFAPLDGIRAAVHRRTARGDVLDPEQRLSLDEALTLHTRTAAAAAGELEERGTLTPGKRADLVLLDRALDERSLAHARVRATIRGGELVHGELRSGPRGGAVDTCG